MTLNNELPIYKATYDLLLKTYQYVNNVPREVRYTLVETLKNQLTELLVLICRANISRNKLPFLEEAKGKILEIKIRFRLLHDMHYIDNRHYALLSLNMESVSKQLTSWHSYFNNRQQPPR